MIDPTSWRLRPEPERGARARVASDRSADPWRGLVRASGSALLTLAVGCSTPPVRPSAEAPPGQPVQDGPRPSAIEERRRSEFDLAERDFVLSAYRPNYVLLLTHNADLDPSVYEEALGGEEVELEEEEVKFQVSVKFPLWREAFTPETDLYFAYTQTAWWQLYAEGDRASAPFRETNYEPELFLRHYGGRGLPWGGKIAGFDVGLNHQSNGRSEPLSRSWNRLIARVGLDYGDLALLAQAWYRLPESEEDDDNPHMYRYLGYGDLRAIWAPDRNTVTLMVRPGTEELGAELTWSYPIADSLRVYVQWYYGYGESLIDYDRRTNRIGIGIAMTDWLARRE